MKKIILSIVIVVASVTAVNAAPIDARQAQKIARATLSANETNGARRAALANAEMRVVLQDDVLAEPAWYVVTPTMGEGFVIVSGDDAEDAVLGYSTEGKADAESMPPALRELLNNYATHISLVRQGVVAPITNEADENEASSMAKVPSAVTPLIKTEWAQAAPFNNLCPIIDGENCLVGCVALSMAQMMYYYQYPVCGTGTVSTRADSPQIESINLDNTPFDYANMLTDYSGSYTDEQANAVAMLCVACGYAVNMQYSASWSAAYQDDQCNTLINTFGYSHTARMISRTGTSLNNDTKWKKRLKEELAAGRPIILSGTNPTSGAHNFICDGYKSLTFHINWGWGPKKNGLTYNGYYKITDLNMPDGTGSYTPGDFTIGITPAVDGEDKSTQYFIAANDSVADYEAEGTDMALTLPSFSNATYSQAKGSIYYLIYDENGNNAGNINLASLTLRGKDTNKTQEIYVNLPANLSDGTYYLSLAFKPTNSECFQKIESMYCKTNLAVTLVGGGITTVTALTDDDVTEAIASEIKNVTTVSVDQTDNNVYNLQGQRISTPQHGLFIKNGKKILVK